MMLNAIGHRDVQNNEEVSLLKNGTGDLPNIEKVTENFNTKEKNRFASTTVRVAIFALACGALSFVCAFVGESIYQVRQIQDPWCEGHIMQFDTNYLKNAAIPGMITGIFSSIMSFGAIGAGCIVSQLRDHSTIIASRTISAITLMFGLPGLFWNVLLFANAHGCPEMETSL